jgi:hypothetical protein
MKKNNSKTRKNNSSGVTGVGWHRKRNKWQAYITINNKDFHLGCFKKKYDAVWERWKAEVKQNGLENSYKSSAYHYIQENHIKQLMQRR